jgi:hypothetical protein
MNNIIQVNITNLEKIIKYILMTLVVIICLIYIPNYSLNYNDIFIVSCIITISYAILDMVSPNIKLYNNSNKKFTIEKNYNL